MDSRTEAPARKGNRKAAPAVSPAPGPSTGPVADAGRPEAPAVPAGVAPAPETRNAPEVFGGACSEFYALISPAAFLVSKGNGTHELTRLYYDGDKYQVAHATQRLGGHTAVGAKYDADGLRVTFLDGQGQSLIVVVPKDRVQLTYIPAGR